MQSQRAMHQSSQIEMQRESLGELLGELASQSAGLVRDEVALAKQEIQEKLSQFQSALLILAAGVFLSGLALFALSAAAILALAVWVGAWQAALIVGGALAVVGGIIALMGIKRLKQTSLKPEQTLETLEEDKEWLKEIT
jgi:uncharacterized membrane protein YqjE